MRFRTPSPILKEAARSNIQQYAERVERHASALEDSGLHAAEAATRRQEQFLGESKQTITRLILQNTNVWPADFIHDAAAMRLPEGFDFADVKLRSSRGEINRESLSFAVRLYVDVWKHIQKTAEVIREIREKFEHERAYLASLERRIATPT